MLSKRQMKVTKKKNTKKTNNSRPKEKLVRNKRQIGRASCRERDLHSFPTRRSSDLVIERFFNEYKIKNKTKFVRDLLIRSVWEKLEANAPTLFSADEMR